MARFKKGDKVRLTRGDGVSLKKGDIVYIAQNDSGIPWVTKHLGDTPTECINDNYAELVGNEEEYPQVGVDFSSTPDTSNIWYLYDSEKFTNNNKTMSMTDIIKGIFRTEPAKTFITAGFMDTNENVTPQGREALEYLLWDLHKDDLKTLADKIISERE